MVRFEIGGEGGGWFPHLPPTPLPLPRCGRGRGDGYPRTFPFAPLPLLQRERKGEVGPLTFPFAPFLFYNGRERGVGGSFSRDGRTGTVRAQ